MTPRSLWRDPSFGPDDVGSIDSALTEACRARRETLAAVDRFDAWQCAAPTQRHAHTVATCAADPSKRVEAVAYATRGNGMPYGEVTGYGRTTLDAIEDLARRGAAKGAW